MSFFSACNSQNRITTQCHLSCVTCRLHDFASFSFRKALITYPLSTKCHMVCYISNLQQDIIILCLHASFSHRILHSHCLFLLLCAFFILFWFWYIVVVASTMNVVHIFTLKWRSSIKYMISDCLFGARTILTP